MSQSHHASYGLGRKQGGGSVKRARDMLKAGVRMDNPSENEKSRGMPPPPRPEPTYSTRSSQRYSQDGNFEVGYQVEHDPRGPVPILPIQGLPAQKHTGPPPTSRRGRPSVASSLKATAVSPIPEENVDKSKKKKESYASSTVIPPGWALGPPTSEIDDHQASEQDEPKRKRDSLVVLRQASLGKRGKPSLRTINKPETEAPLLHAKFNKSNDSSLGYSTVNGLERRPSLDSVSTDSDSIDLEKERIAIENEQKARGIGISLGLGQPGAGMSSRKPNSHRPPRLDMDAVRAAEAQGSLTSLPDLIRRATRVASNLERGKTASRLGILDMFDFGKEGKGNSNHRTSASLSDILASFPPPRTGTPEDKVRSSWPFPPINATEKSRLRQMRVNSGEESEDAGKPGRRFCGMSRRLFLFVCVIVFCIIAAAVVIPVVLLVVLPRERAHSSTTTASAANTTTMTMTCEQKLPCMNGGVSIETGTTCACVCVDGYSGTQCSKASDGSCTTTATSESHNATIGSSLPALFTQSESYFNIPLNETEILSLFNANNVSCTVQNALVSFGGISSSHQRRASPIQIRDLGAKPQITTAPIVQRAQETESLLSATYVPPILSVPSSAETTTSKGAAETAGGAAVIATTGTPTSAQATKASTSVTAASASVSVSAAVAQVYEFASVAVLYLFGQTRDFNATSTAQHEIDLYLLSQSIGTSTSSINMNMSLSMPETFVLSFTNFTITLSNGTVVGGG